MINPYSLIRAAEVKANGLLIGTERSPISGTYSYWRYSYNTRDLAVIIHEEDQDVAAVIDIRSGLVVYQHPVTAKGGEILQSMCN